MRDDGAEGLRWLERRTGDATEFGREEEQALCVEERARGKRSRDEEKSKERKDYEQSYATAGFVKGDGGEEGDEKACWKLLLQRRTSTRRDTPCLDIRASLFASRTASQRRPASCFALGRESSDRLARHRHRPKRDCPAPNL